MGATGASRWLLAVRVLLGAAVCAYPVLVWLGLTHGSPRRLALALLCVVVAALLLGLRSPRRGPHRALAALPLITAALLGLAAILDAGGYVLAVPVAINAGLLVAFGSTLRRGSVPMVERFARLQSESLSAAQQRWCRLWTRIWCAFFVLNGTTAAVLALAAPLAWWTFYNGLLAYALMGLLFATERVLRWRRFGPGSSTALAWEPLAVRRVDARSIHSFRTRLPEDYAFFAGHFPGYPVLAGAVQLHELILPCLRRVRPEAGPLERLTGLKFPKRICPGDALEVRLGLNDDRGEVEFEILRGEVRCTQGRLSLGRGPGEPA
jgi:uncharacterized membrane protein